MTETEPQDSRMSILNAAIGYTRQPLGGPMSGDRRLAGAGPRRPTSDAPRRPNTSAKPSMSGPAGDHYSTAGDFLKLARALLGYRLLDSTHTIALLGQRYAAGTDFRANGGGPGANAEFSIFPTGEVMVVLSNYDPPAATSVAELIRGRIAPVAGTR
jgi:hypothetical protein